MSTTIANEYASRNTVKRQTTAVEYLDFMLSNEKFNEIVKT